MTLAISSILILSLYSIFNFTVKAYTIGNMEDELLLNGRYAVEFIKREIQSADKIMDINIIPELSRKYPNNFGFIVMRTDTSNKFKYNYSTYYLKNNIVYRIAANMNTENYPNELAFSGHNAIAEHVVSIEGTVINFETNLIDLNFILKSKNTKEYKFKTRLCIKCPTEY